MLFSSLSLKVLFGLGTVVGASVLSIHLKSKDTNTGTLNSKQGEAVVIPLKPEAVVIPLKPEAVVMPELDEPAMPEPEAVVTPEQAAEKKLADLNYKIKTLDEDIGNRTSTIKILEAEMPKLEEKSKHECKINHDDKIEYGKSAAIDPASTQTKKLLAKQYESQEICDTAEKELNDAKTKKTQLDREVTRKQNTRESLRPFK